MNENQTVYYGHYMRTSNGPWLDQPALYAEIERLKAENECYRDCHDALIEATLDQYERSERAEAQVAELRAVLEQVDAELGEGRTDQLLQRIVAVRGAGWEGLRLTLLARRALANTKGAEQEK